MMKGGPSPLTDMTSVYATQRNLLASNYNSEFCKDSYHATHTVHYA